MMDGESMSINSAVHAREKWGHHTHSHAKSRTTAQDIATKLHYTSCDFSSQQRHCLSRWLLWRHRKKWVNGTSIKQDVTMSLIEVFSQLSSSMMLLLLTRIRVMMSTRCDGRTSVTRKNVECIAVMSKCSWAFDCSSIVSTMMLLTFWHEPRSLTYAIMSCHAGGIV